MNLLFTSAGDNNNLIDLWVSDHQNYDIYLYYYGNNEIIYQNYKNNVKYTFKKNGAKYQNFYHFYKNNPKIINEYDRFFLLDDDIIIKTKDINRMFKYSQEYDLDICAPAFNNDGKISHRITEYKPNVLLEFTNFVENNTALYSKKAIDNLINVYDTSIIGWGIDYLAIWSNGLDIKNKYAIIHDIQCTNPEDTKKNGKRELNLIPGADMSFEYWKIYAKKINCPICWNHEIYKTIFQNGTYSQESS